MNSTIKLKDEDELLLCCARTHIEAPVVEKINKLLQKDLEWDYLIDLASVHSLRSLLYFQLSQICPENVPSNVMNQLKDHYKLNARRNLLMFGELFKILKLLESESTKAIPYKGPVLAGKTYGNLSLREFSDLDIFIDKKDVLKVKEILVSSGYLPKLKLSKEREIQYLKIQREYQFINKESGVSVEIQWNLVDISLSFPDEHVFTMNQIKTQLAEINNKKISVFSDEDLLLILSLHTVTHLWGKLSWISDIAELVKNSEKLNWDRIIEKSKQMAVERILYLNLALCSELYDVELPEEVKQKINSDKKIKCLKQDLLRIIFDPENYGFLKRFCLRFKIR
ncbi:MAG: nucleotidyltransferase family protein, partial [Methanobacterium sp.]|nr:nucleotidyltransferase family protein [Methanobacterium sp.]